MKKSCRVAVLGLGGGAILAIGSMWSYTTEIYADPCQQGPTVSISEWIDVPLDTVEGIGTQHVHFVLRNHALSYLESKYGDAFIGTNVNVTMAMDVVRSNHLITIANLTGTKLACESFDHAEDLLLNLSETSYGKLWIFAENKHLLPGGGQQDTQTDQTTADIWLPPGVQQVLVEYKVEYCFTDDNGTTVCFTDVIEVYVIQ